MTAQRDNGTFEPGELTREFLRLYKEMTPVMQGLFERIIDALSGGPPLAGADLNRAIGLGEEAKAAGCWSDAQVCEWIDLLLTVAAGAGQVM